MNVNGKRVLVCGMARGGIAAAKLLLSLGAQVTITDTKPEADFGGALDELRAPGCVFALGQAADALIAGQDMMIISPGIAWAKPFVQSAIAQGVEVMTCGTCLNHYGLTEKLAVGSVTNMYVIAQTMMEADHIVKP